MVEIKTGRTCRVCNKSIADLEESIFIKFNPLEPIEIGDDLIPSNRIMVCIDCAQESIEKHLGERGLNSWITCRSNQLEYLPILDTYEDEYIGDRRKPIGSWGRFGPTWVNDYCGYCGHKWSTMWYADSLFGGFVCRECDTLQGLRNDLSSVKSDLGNFSFTSAYQEKEKAVLLEIDNAKKQNMGQDTLNILLQDYGRLNPTTFKEDLGKRQIEIEKDIVRLKTINSLSTTISNQIIRL